MGCEKATIKYAVFLSNIIGAILGIGTIVVSCLALQNYTGEEHIICIFIIMLGSIIFLISFLGCFGAIRENTCITWTSAIFLLILIIGNIVIIFGYLSHIDGETKARTDIDTAWALQLNGTDGMSHIQLTLGCCGIKNSSDYINTKIVIPKSCFVDGKYDKSMILYSDGCLKKLIALYEAAEHWITIFVWSSFSVEMAALVSVCVLAITFMNQQRRARY